MAKTGAKKANTRAAGSGGVISGMKNFEERLEKLEALGAKIRKTDLPLDEALKAFEEGIRLARALENDLEKVESRIEILMNSADAPEEESPELELFNTNNSI